MNVRRLVTICSMAAGLTAAAIGYIGAVTCCPLSADSDSDKRTKKDVIPAAEPVDTCDAPINPETWEGGKAEMPAADEESRYTRLTDEDFAVVAEELGVEVAAIKAVVRIEAGSAMEGFYAPGVPIINFDRSMYKIYAKKAVNTAGDKNAKVPPGLSGRPLKKWTTLTNMRRINAEGADMSTFWGMFQIGGFNYKRCGCETIQEFVRLMSRSEFDQLELFAAFVVNTGYVTYIQKKDWAGFSRKYNGPSYAKRGYHTKMAAAYAKYKSQ